MNRGFLAASGVGLVSWTLLWLSAVIAYTPNGNARWVFYAGVLLIPLLIIGTIYAVNEYDELKEKVREGERARWDLKHAKSSAENWKNIANLYEKAILDLPYTQQKRIETTRELARELKTDMIRHRSF